MLLILLMSALLVVLCPCMAWGKGLPVNLSSYTKYKSYNTKGVIFVVHESLYKHKDSTQEALAYWGHTISRIEKICPDTVAHLKKNKYKFYLYYLPASRGGMEFIRDGQHRWDSRLNNYVNKGIIIPRGHIYSTYSQREAGLFYLLHEIAHYRHVVMMGEKGSPQDIAIRIAYHKAMRNPLYRGTYASKNHLEYFAEASMAYLLKKHTVSVFPSSSKQLYEKDRIGYNLCREIWGKNAAAYKPNESPPLVAVNSSPKSPPAQSMSPWGMAPDPTLILPPSGIDTYSIPTGYSNSGKMSFRERQMAHATKVYKMPSKGTVIISKQFLEIKDSISRAEIEEFSGNFAMSNWGYSNSLSMLNKFKEENPYWNASVIDNMINSIKTKID